MTSPNTAWAREEAERLAHTICRLHGEPYIEAIKSTLLAVERKAKEECARIAEQEAHDPPPSEHVDGWIEGAFKVADRIKATPHQPARSDPRMSADTSKWTAEEWALQQIIHKYTEARPVIEGEPNTQNVFLVVGSQQFCVTKYSCDNGADAEWIRRLLAKAIQKIIASAAAASLNALTTSDTEREELVLLRQRVADMTRALEQLQRALTVPPHKRTDIEFLRASCNIAKSFIDLALASSDSKGESK